MEAVTRRAKRGFNLIEAAIVLAVVGGVIGGIWVAASAVTNSYREAKAISDLLEIVKNTQQLFTGHNVISAPTAHVLAIQLQSAGATPKDLEVRDGFLRNRYGGELLIGINNSDIIISYFGLPTKTCIALANKSSSVASRNNLIQMNVGGATINSSGDVTTSSSQITSFPLSLKNASSNCRNWTMSQNTGYIAWRFNKKY